MPRDPVEESLVVRAKARLDRLHLYPRPVDVRRVRVLSTPWLQDQHRRLYPWASYLWQGYRDDEHEVQAREAVRLTRGL